MLFHPVIFLHHFKRFVDIELFRAKKSQQESFVLASFLLEIAARQQLPQLLHFRARFMVFIQFLIGFFAPIFVFNVERKLFKNSSTLLSLLPYPNFYSIPFQTQHGDP